MIRAKIIAVPNTVAVNRYMNLNSVRCMNNSKINDTPLKHKLREILLCIEAVCHVAKLLRVIRSDSDRKGFARWSTEYCPSIVHATLKLDAQGLRKKRNFEIVSHYCVGEICGSKRNFVFDLSRVF